MFFNPWFKFTLILYSCWPSCVFAYPGLTRLLTLPCGLNDCTSGSCKELICDRFRILRFRFGACGIERLLSSLHTCVDLIVELVYQVLLIAHKSCKCHVLLAQLLEVCLWSHPFDSNDCCTAALFRAVLLALPGTTMAACTCSCSCRHQIGKHIVA